MKKPTQLLSVMALSIGFALSVPAPSLAALPSQVPGQPAIPSLAPMLEKVLPAVVSVRVQGSAVQNPQLPDEFKKFEIIGKISFRLIRETFI